MYRWISYMWVLINSESTFLHGMWVWVEIHLHSLHMDIGTVSLLFSHAIISSPMPKSVSHQCAGLFLDSQFHSLAYMSKPVPYSLDDTVDLDPMHAVGLHCTQRTLSLGNLYHNASRPSLCLRNGPREKVVMALQFWLTQEKHRRIRAPWKTLSPEKTKAI